MFLVFQLKTHSHLYSGDSVNVEPSEKSELGAEESLESGKKDAPKEEEEEEPQMSLVASLIA